MSSQNPVPHSQSREHAATVSTVLAVLSQHESKLFFETDFSDQFSHPNCEIQVLDSETQDHESWPRLLEAVRPTILVTAWSTPPLAKDFPFEKVGLTYVCHLAGSIRDKIPVELIERGLRVTNWGNSISRTIAESALMLTLMGLRRAAHWHEILHHEGGWNTSRDFEGQLSLFGRRVGFHGFGRIAHELVTLMRPFHPALSTYSPHDSDEVLEKHGVNRCQTLDQLFAGNDVIIELAALNSDTYHSVSQHQFDLMPDNGVFVNVGRGAVVDEEALVREADKGRIRIALDVFETEPPPRDAPLRAMTDITMMPHQSGPTSDQGVCAGKFAIENIHRFLAGEPLQAQVNPRAFGLMT